MTIVLDFSDYESMDAALDAAALAILDCFRDEIEAER